MNHPRVSRSSRLPIVVLTAGWLAAISVAGARPASAAEPGDLGTLFQVNDADPLSNIPSAKERNEHPLEFGYYLQDLIARAEGAFKNKDWARAVKYFEVIARLLPDHALTFSRLCTAYAELGHVDAAAGNCAHAIQLQGATVADHLRFIRFTLDKEKFSAADAADIDASIAHLRAKKPELWSPAASGAASSSAAARAGSAAPAPNEDQKGSEIAQRALAPVAEADAKAPPPPNLRLQVETLACRLAVRLEDAKRLATCVAGLKNVGADPRLVLSFDWSRALVTGDRKSAEGLLDQAHALKMPDSALRAMEAEEDRYFKPAGLALLTHGKTGRITAVVATLSLITGALFWMFASGRRRKLPVEDQPS